MIFVSSKTSDGNMSIFCGDAEQAIKNKRKFFQKNKINPKNVVELQQMHGNKILKVISIPTKVAKADGLMTNNPNIFLMIKAADCHQIGFYDPIHSAITLIHVGYKSLQKEIIKNAIDKMKKYFKTNPKDLIVKFGSSIGPCHYRMDLWGEAEKQLIQCGVLKGNIDNPKICTYESKDYFSHRRAEDQRLPDYRFATILGLK